MSFVLSNLHMSNLLNDKYTIKQLVDDVQLSFITLTAYELNSNLKNKSE